MRVVSRFIVISDMHRDSERRRWYSYAATSCLVLTEHHRLLEPFPVFGPTGYRLLGRHVELAEARAYAHAHGCSHERTLPAAGLVA